LREAGATAYREEFFPSRDAHGLGSGATGDSADCVAYLPVEKKTHVVLPFSI
jgi:hypothetical protein